jgi:hypothetical protein
MKTHFTARKCVFAADRRSRKMKQVGYVRKNYKSKMYI